MIKTTLQARLVSLLVLSSLFLVSTFTAIQLNREIQQSREYNIYQARQEALVARDRLQEIFANEQTARGTLIVESKNIMMSILDSAAIETASLLNKDGHPEILEGNLKLFFEDDRAFLEDLAKTGDAEKWFVPVIDKTHKLINLFILFKNKQGYILKLTLSLGNIQKALNAVYIPVIITVMIVILGNIILGVLLAWVVISPIKILNEATKDVASGNLDLKIHINTRDELEELSTTFNYMTEELKKMKAKAENANPLTKLPGNILIREEVERRIASGKKFVLLYGDLDNFKAFNDKYGVHSGDEAIMISADIFKGAIAKEGGSDDFIGHEGGDDFLTLTTPERAERIAEYVTAEFDKRIRNLYPPADLEKGYIEAKARGTDQIVKFPIMSISVAGVSNTKRDIESYAQLTNIAAEVKGAAKKIKGSSFVIDRRTEDLGVGSRG